ncbi:class I adenylate-forming enzyme family protein [Paracraurococcus lichenis]|uniref:AMP-binding protein n=1 Tax=Paracraurococcus lichenis TaxID=3064888 RepID=A0ABT9EA38_9PROT|nr:AMP-binding protein [Paracraurococcus sp. LOR1-02]MDO9712785.1 AMP-binding protein [Paracraurococcus sp. LOR1-02]
MPALPVWGVGEPRPDLRTVSAMFDHAVATAPEAVMLRHLDTTLTYREAGRAVAALARRLAADAEPGAVVALLLPNSAEFDIAYFAALRAATVPALLNPLYPAPQLEPLLREVMPRAVICTPATRDLVRGLAGRLGIASVICLGAEVTLAGLVAEPEARLDRPAAAPDDVAALLFSGGTTGLPKAVEHTHGRLVTAVRCVEYNWPTRMSGEVWLPIAPFTHVYGFLQGVLAPVSARAEVVIPERFKPEHVVEMLARHRVTVFGGGPPAIYAGLLAAANLPGADLSALRICPAGGAPMPLELHQRWKRATGLDVHEGYGMTEMAPISGTTALSGVRPGSVGPAIPCNEIQIVDLETGRRILPAGERGEVRVRGPHMMTGHRNRPQETAETIRDGFIYTGDIGHLDADGFLFITDRRKDVVLVKGFNVFPREVEEVLYAHPRVAAAGVVGVADARTGGEALVAYVVPRAGEAITEAELAAHLAERLVAYKCPGEIRIVEALPMTGAQKLDRIALRRAAADSLSGPG